MVTRIDVHLQSRNISVYWLWLLRFVTCLDKNSHCVNLRVFTIRICNFGTFVDLCTDVTDTPEWALLILKPFRHFIYVTAHSPTLPSLYLRHSSLILQTFRDFTYDTAHSPTLPSLYLRHSSFSNPFVASATSQFIFHPSFASPTSQALHLRHLTSRPWP